jgi:hypothetical protein
MDKIFNPGDRVRGTFGTGTVVTSDRHNTLATFKVGNEHKTYQCFTPNLEPYSEPVEEKITLAPRYLREMVKRA